MALDRDVPWKRPMRFGTFLAPFHRAGENPTLALRRDLELIERLDQLGYDEAWIGEHHSLGWELVGSPEAFIAAAAERTRRIRLGTGVVSLTHHHPFIVADRAVLLDHLTQGRFMLGVGPGAHVSDSHMMGRDYMQARRMMTESLEVVVQLLTSEEPVTARTDWFELRDAKLHLRPFTYPCFDISVASAISPSGARLAGQHGLGLLSISATSPEGFEALRFTWSVMEEKAAEHGMRVDRSTWALVGLLHVAESAEQARRDVRFGVAPFVDYLGKVSPMQLVPPEITDPDRITDILIETGFAVIGTPDDAVAQIQRLQEQSGGFGAYLTFGHEWADREATLRSFELVARHVMPHFQGSAARAIESCEWGTLGRRQADLKSTYLSALDDATKAHFDEVEQRSAAPATGA